MVFNTIEKRLQRLEFVCKKNFHFKPNMYDTIRTVYGDLFYFLFIIYGYHNFFVIKAQVICVQQWWYEHITKSFYIVAFTKYHDHTFGPTDGLTFRKTSNWKSHKQYWYWEDNGGTRWNNGATTVPQRCHYRATTVPTFVHRL